MLLDLVERVVDDGEVLDRKEEVEDELQEQDHPEHRDDRHRLVVLDQVLDLVDLPIAEDEFIQIQAELARVVVKVVIFFVDLEQLLLIVAVLVILILVQFVVIVLLILLLVKVLHDPLEQPISLDAQPVVDDLLLLSLQ